MQSSAHPYQFGDESAAEVAAATISRHGLAAGEAERGILAIAAVEVGRRPASIAARLQHQVEAHGGLRHGENPSARRGGSALFRL
ncbi:hypothetical protein B296_00040233 [Ensete ventricosum]|uniref:Uncharacterized protein n=1 Tax=Ensete ventricosum TaxID=4639 RepID=A0A426YWE1_ENSVE|nr:hypothetical protein B296_00040233 [Ensete ventricosum]